MSRYDVALAMFTEQPDLEGIANRLLSAIKEAKAEGVDPEGDPAVWLFGARIAFVTHADVATNTMYSQLIDICAERASLRAPCH